MKKILFGLAAMSAISFAEAPDLSAPAADGTNLFLESQTGAIPVKGKIMTDVPEVKYVIFASTGDGSSIAEAETTLQLSDFVLSQESTKGGFAATNPTVYVKQVGAGNTLEAPAAEVGFRVKIDSAWVAVTSETIFGEFLSSGNFTIQPGLLMNREKMESILEKIPTDLENGEAFYMGEFGEIMYEHPTQANYEDYRAKTVELQISNATLKIVEGAPEDEGTTELCSPANAAKLEAALSTGIELEPSLAIEVKIK